MDATKAGEALWTLHLDHMRAMNQIVDESRIRGESGMLLYLYHAGRPMFPGELTEKMGLTTGRIANILKVLERSDLVVRTPDALDKRRVRVALTPRGEAAARQQQEEAVRFHARLIAQLNEGEARTFVDVLTRLAAVLDSDAPKGVHT